MSDLYWPVADSFPQDLLISNEEELNDNSISSEMEVGPPTRRLRDTVTFSTWTGQLILTTAQRITLKTFWSNDCKFGTIPFIWKDPLTEAAKSFWLTGSPIFTPLGGGLHSCSITIREVPE